MNFFISNKNCSQLVIETKNKKKKKTEKAEMKSLNKVEFSSKFGGYVQSLKEMCKRYIIITIITGIVIIIIIIIIIIIKHIKRKNYSKQGEAIIHSPLLSITHQQGIEHY